MWKESAMVIRGGEPLLRAYVLESLHCEAPPYEGDKRNTQDFKINSELPLVQREVLIKVLCNYLDVFAPNPKSPKAVAGVLHRIGTGNAQPVKQRVCPVAPAVEEEIINQVDEMLKKMVSAGNPIPHGLVELY